MAGAYASEGDDSLITDINVTPLVDVVLVLLIVFLITMPTIVSMDLMNERELNVVLPSAGAAAPLITKPAGLVVNIDVQGNFTVHQQPVSRDELLKLLLQAAADNPGRASVLIRGDKHSHLQFAATVMALCNQAKVQYTIGTND